MTDSSWWFKLARRETKPARYEEDENGEKVMVSKARTGLAIDYDHVMNRIERERGNAARMGLQLVVEAAPLTDHYTLYTTTRIDGKKVALYNEQGTTVVPRSSLFWNGSYLWSNAVTPV